MRGCISNIGKFPPLAAKGAFCISLLATFAIFAAEVCIFGGLVGSVHFLGVGWKCTFFGLFDHILASVLASQSTSEYVTLAEFVIDLKQYNLIQDISVSL